jgi:hypothetical protein
MRLFDKILIEETNRQLTMIDDIAYLVLSPSAVNQLTLECQEEFDLEKITLENLMDNMGMNIRVDKTMANDFDFILR